MKKKKQKNTHTTPVEKETLGNSEVACSSDTVVAFSFDGIETSPSAHILYSINYLYYHYFDDYNNYFLCCLKGYDEFNK